MKILIFIIITLLIIRLLFVIRRIENNKMFKELTDSLSLFEKLTWLFLGFNTLTILTLLIILFL